MIQVDGLLESVEVFAVGQLEGIHHGLNVTPVVLAFIGLFLKAATVHWPEIADGTFVEVPVGVLKVLIETITATPGASMSDLLPRDAVNQGIRSR